MRHRVVVRALITGITGFLGQHLARALKDRNLEFRGIARRAPRAESDVVSVSAFDLGNQGKLDELLEDFRPTHVFHLAAALRTEHQQAESIIRSNVTLTQQFMELLSRRDHAPVIVLPSSAAIYGRPQSLPITESHPVAPLDLYGVTKAAQEIVFDQHHRAWRCPIRILRIFNMIGPGQPTSLVASSVARQIVLIERGEQSEIEVGNLTTKRDLVDVRDVARACIAAALYDADRAVFNVCSGVSTATSACVDLLQQSSSVPVNIVRREARLRANDIADHRGDPTSIRITLGWQAEIPVETSMLELLEYWRDQLSKDDSA